MLPIPAGAFEAGLTATAESYHDELLYCTECKEKVTKKKTVVCYFLNCVNVNAYVTCIFSHNRLRRVHCVVNLQRVMCGSWCDIIKNPDETPSIIKVVPSENGRWDKAARGHVRTGGGRPVNAPLRYDFAVLINGTSNPNQKYRPYTLIAIQSHSGIHCMNVFDFFNESYLKKFQRKLFCALTTDTSLIRPGHSGSDFFLCNDAIITRYRQKSDDLQSPEDYISELQSADHYISELQSPDDYIYWYQSTF